MCIADDANMRPKYQRNDAHILGSSICIISKYSILGTTESGKISSSAQRHVCTAILNLSLLYLCQREYSCKGKRELQRARLLKS